MKPPAVFAAGPPEAPGAEAEEPSTSSINTSSRPTYGPLQTQDDADATLKAWGEMIDKGDSDGVLYMLAQRFQNNQQPTLEETLNEVRECTALLLDASSERTCTTGQDDGRHRETTKQTPPHTAFIQLLRLRQSLHTRPPVSASSSLSCVPQDFHIRLASQ